MKNPLHTFLILPAILISAGLLSAQDPDQAIRINNPSGDTLFYCGAPVVVVPEIVIENYNSNSQDDGIRISIANYVPGEDTLFYAGNNFTPIWDEEIGNLELTGPGTAAQLEDAVAQVYYENTSATPTPEFRSISISLLDADFLPESGHFYQFVNQVDITWSEARAAAAMSSYYGLEGYLATITTEAENDFIWSKINGLGWIGATDEGDEENWRWDTGPEAGTIFWQGNEDGQPVNGHYSNWSEGEPNNNYEEHYAHINLDPNKNEKTWNDLAPGGDGIPGSAYRSQGYIVEFGGMPNDPEIQLSASAVIGVNQVPEVIISEYDTLLCGVQQQQIQIQVDQEYSTILRAIDANSIVLDSTSLNPTVQVQEPGRYHFELETFNENQCSWYDIITVSFWDQPDVRLNIDAAECVDADFRLFSAGNVGSDAFYEWYANGVIIDSGVNLDTVIIPFENYLSDGTAGLKIIKNTCVDSVEIPVTIKPEIEFVAEYDSIVCGILQHEINIRTQPEVEFVTRPLDPNSEVLDEAGENPVVTVQEPGIYRFEVKSISDNQCSWVDTITVSFRDHPDVRLNIDAAECVDADFRLFSAGNVGSDAFYVWYANGVIIDSGVNLDTVIVPVEIYLSNGTAGLKIIENTCVDSVEIPVTIKPEIEFVAEYDSIVCGILQHEINIRTQPGVEFVTRPLDPNSIVLDSTSLNPTVQVQESGRYHFELETFNENQCTWYDTISIFFQNQPVAELNIDENSCVDYNLQLVFQGDAEDDALYEWYSNDTVFNSGIDLNSTVISLGEGISNRTVGVKVSKNGCADSIQIPITVKPTLEIQADQTEGCSPLNVQFKYTASERVNEFNWQFGEKDSSTIENPEFTFEIAGTGDVSFDVSLTVISTEGCVSSDTVENMIQVLPMPTVDLNFDESVCYEGMEEIWYRGNAGSGDTFIWDLSDIQPENLIENPGNSAGPLLFDLTDRTTAEIGLQVLSEFGCKTDTLMKTYKRNPVISIAPDTLGGCPPFEVNLSASTTNFTDQVEYLWDLGNGNTAGGHTVSEVYSQENQFFDVTVYGVSSLTGCADSLLLPGKVFVYPVPEASFTVSNTSVLVSDSEIRFQNTSSDASIYDWDFGDDSFGSRDQNPVHRYENLGLFDVTLLAFNRFGCVDSAFTQIAVAFDKVFPPTAFSPNAAMEEDREFRIYAEGIINEGYKLLIFNRWGEVIFTSNTPEKGWDGKMKNGSNAPPGAYFWVLEYFDLLGKEHSQKGSLTLLY